MEVLVLFRRKAPSHRNMEKLPFPGEGFRIENRRLGSLFEDRRIRQKKNPKKKKKPKKNPVKKPKKKPKKKPEKKTQKKKTHTQTPYDDHHPLHSFIYASYALKWIGEVTDH